MEDNYNSYKYESTITVLSVGTKVNKPQGHRFQTGRLPNSKQGKRFLL